MNKYIEKFLLMKTGSKFPFWEENARSHMVETNSNNENLACK